MTRRNTTLFISAAIFFSFETLLGVAASFAAHDLYTLKSPGGGFTSVFPTGLRPAGGGVVGGQGAHGDNFAHAFLWTSGANPIDLNPTGFTNSYIWAADATHQVGYAANNRTGIGHGYLWSGSAASGIDLTPSGYSSAAPYASSETRQVGSVAGTPTGSFDHAAMWLGSAASFVDINPAGFTTSQAFGLDAAHEVGSGSGAATNNEEHALLWTGGGAVIDLHPTGFVRSQAVVVGDGREAGVGYLSTAGDPQALVWDGASPTAENLTPEGFTGSVARDVTAHDVIGFTLSADFAVRAAYWTDSVESYVNLDALLGPGFVNSQAFSIDSAGVIYGTALDSANVYHAVSWTPVAAPMLAGDYNRNGVVDAADYVLWRQLTGQSEDLAADGDGNHVVDAADYDVWRQHFGETAAGAGFNVGAANGVAVPEPGTLALLFMALLAASGESFARMQRG